MEGVPAGEGTLSHSPGGSHHYPTLQHPAAPPEPSREGPPSPARRKRCLSHHSCFLREEWALLYSQTRCREKIIFYQVADRTGRREICRVEEIHSYLHRFGRGASKAPPSSKKRKQRVKGNPLCSNVLALSEDWKVTCRLIAGPEFSSLVSFFQSTYSTVTFKTEKPIFYTHVYFKSQCLHRGN